MQHIVNIAEICARKQVRNIILSPGSRCAPLTISFVRHPEISVKTISDERSAAFIALGMAQQLKQSVGLVCTSGSAAYNYAPAVAEAFFQQIPLLLFTADRPPEWVDQMDGQTIKQQNIYGNHVKKSYQLPLSFDHPDDTWYSERIISEAINLSKAFPPGPVHVNVPLREPLYPSSNEKITYKKDLKVIAELHSESKLSKEAKKNILETFLRFDKILLVAGQASYDQKLIDIIEEFITKNKIPLVADILANLHPIEETIRHHDLFLKNSGPDMVDLQPQLLITFGKSVISKALKTFLRKNKPIEHWHIQEAGEVADTFQSLTHIVREEVHNFFADLSNKGNNLNQERKAYFDHWHATDKKSSDYIKDFFTKTAFGEFLAVDIILKKMPACNLHISNSMPVRYANFVNIEAEKQNIEVNVNRGTSGIDGSNSTAVGASLASQKLTLLLTGDMAFFYDRNAFWHNYPMPNLRIIILNNHAGGIFRIIDGPSNLPELEEFFETYQPLNASNLAEEFNFDYQACHDQEKLTSALETFFSPGPSKILEIFSDSKENHKIFKIFKENFR